MANGMDIRKKLNDELEMINKSLKGKKTIESAKTLSELPTNNSKDDLFNVIKELFKLTKKALSHIPPDTTGSVASDNSGLEDLIRKQLTEVLPGLLQSALQDQTPQVQVKSETITREDKPVTMHTLVIEKKAENGDEKITEEEWTTVVKKDVKGKLKNVPVIKATSSNGGAKLHFKSKEHLDRAQEALKEEYKVTSKSEEKKKLNPKLTIADIDPDVTSDEMLLNGLLNKDDDIRCLKEAGELLKVVFFDKGERFAVIQVSPKIREVIRRNRDRVCIDLQYYNVKDRIHVIQCYHCQEYGHMSSSPYCKQKDQDPTCFYCAGKHASKDCRNKKDKKTSSLKCSNCAKSKNRNERNTCGTHKASDTLCPFYVRERERVMSRTAGCEETKNVYLRKVKELRQRYGRV